MTTVQQESISWEQKRYKELINDLKKIDTIYVVGTRKSNNENWDAGHWRHYSLYYIKNNKLERIFIYHDLKDYQKPSAWNQDTHSFTDNVLGSDRTHEIVYSLWHKVYPKTRNVLSKMPKIEFLSYFDGRLDDDKQDEIEREEDQEN